MSGVLHVAHTHPQHITNVFALSINHISSTVLITGAAMHIIKSLCPSCSAHTPSGILFSSFMISACEDIHPKHAFNCNVKHESKSSESERQHPFTSILVRFNFFLFIVISHCISGTKGDLVARETETWVAKSSCGSSSLPQERSEALKDISQEEMSDPYSTALCGAENEAACSLMSSYCKLSITMPALPGPEPPGRASLKTRMEQEQELLSLGVPVPPLCAGSRAQAGIASHRGLCLRAHMRREICE